MQLQQRYCCVQSGYQSAVTDMEVTTEADRAFAIWFLRVSCFLSASCTEQKEVVPAMDVSATASAGTC